ncbi:tyrosine-type recombinase/integrase [Lutimaribacter pacificus]
MDARVLPRVKAKVKHHNAMRWQNVPAFYAQPSQQSGTAAKALMFTCLTGCRTSEVLQAVWTEFDFDELIWTIPEDRTKTGTEHRVPLTDQMLEIVEPLKALRAECVFEGQRRHKPLSNMSMLMLLRRMNIEGVTVHGFRSAFRDWASEVGNHPREVAEMSLGHKVGSEVERAYARSELLLKRRELMGQWSEFCVGEGTTA